MALELSTLDIVYMHAADLGEYKTVVREYVDAALGMDAHEKRGAICNGCLVFRFFSFDTGYYFAAPLPYAEDADIRRTYEEIYAYCLREAVPATIVGVQEDELSAATDGYTSAEAIDMGDGEYLVRLVTECMKCEELPETMRGDVYLGEFAASYAADYARLLEDKELNKYYGYDVTEDVDTTDPMDYILTARYEFENGESMTFAATVLSENGENVFVGEGVLYAFDGMGGASLAFRVLPEHLRRGYGTDIFLALTDIADTIGLKRVRCDVLCENSASLALLSRFKKPLISDGTAHFEFDIPFI